MLLLTAIMEERRSTRSKNLGFNLRNMQYSSLDEGNVIILFSYLDFDPIVVSKYLNFLCVAHSKHGYL